MSDRQKYIKCIWVNGGIIICVKYEPTKEQLDEFFKIIEKQLDLSEVADKKNMEEIKDLFGKQFKKTMDKYTGIVQGMNHLEMKVWILYFLQHLLARIIANEYKTRAKIDLLELKLEGKKKNYSEILLKIVRENIENDMDEINIMAQKAHQQVRIRKRRIAKNKK
jgi:hypothetical protein